MKAGHSETWLRLLSVLLDLLGILQHFALSRALIEKQS